MHPQIFDLVTMSGQQYKKPPTLASMKERNRINKLLQNSPPTPPREHFHDVPAETSTQVIRRSNRNKAVQLEPSDVSAFVLE
jgi:hypothetical protein